jgi:hypothetical protein
LEALGIKVQACKAGMRYEIVELCQVKVYLKGGDSAVAFYGELPEELEPVAEALGFGKVSPEPLDKWRMARMDRSPGKKEFDYESLNPGIRSLVKWFHEKGFETTDSGDGQTHEQPCDRDHPYIVVRVQDPHRLIQETQRVFQCLGDLATKEGVLVQGNYSPSDGMAFVDISGLSDRDLHTRGS